MSRIELNSLYLNYLDDIAELPNIRQSLKYTHYKGILHGLGIALDYDYEKVEQDISRAAGSEPMPEQLCLAI